jgi:RNA polymerase sigma-70 factor (ECF subfamily)
LLNRAVAIAEIDGPAAGLTLVDRLDLDRYYLFHAIRAELLRRLGRPDEAAAAYEAAVTRTDNITEGEFLLRRRRTLTGS